MICKKQHICKKIFMYLLIFSCIFMIPTIGARASSDVIENNNSGIPDQGLYQAILETLGKKPNQKFTKQEVEKIKFVEAACREVKSLKGIGYLKQLEILGIQGNQLKNLKGIEKLTKLETLYAEDNLIKNLKPLKNLKKLTYIDCSRNQIKSLKGIQNLKNLKSLELRNNCLTSISEVKNMNKLEYLSISENQLTSIKDLKKLKNLKTLNLSFNQVKSLKGVEKLTNLTFLNARGNQLTSIKHVKKLKSLKKLFINENQLKSLNGIQKLLKLEKLNASSNQLDTLNGIQNLRKLKHLYLGRNYLTSINEIESLKKLWTLDVSYNRLASLPSFAKIRKLSSFNILFNNLSTEEIRTKVPTYLIPDMEKYIEYVSVFQNVDYTIEITEPVISQISMATKKITGRTHIPGATIRLMLTGDINDEEAILYWRYEAKADENGNFAFENLDFDKLNPRLNYYIAFDVKNNDYDTESYRDPGLRWYRIK